MFELNSGRRHGANRDPHRVHRRSAFPHASPLSSAAQWGVLLSAVAGLLFQSPAPAVAAGPVSVAAAPRPSARARIDYLQWFNNRPRPTSASSANDLYATSFAYLKPVDNPALLTQAALAPREDVPALVRWLADDQMALRFFRGASKRNDFHADLLPASQTSGRSDWNEALLNTSFPGLTAFGTLARAVLIEGWRRWNDGDQEEIIEQALVCLGAARHLSSTEPMVARLQSLDMAELTYTALRRAIALAKDQGAFASDVVIRVGPADPEIDSLREAYLFQRMVVWDALQRAYAGPNQTVADATRPVYESLAKTAGPSCPPWAAAKKQLADIGFEKSVAEADAFFDKLLAWNDKPHFQAARSVSEIDELIAGLGNPLTRAIVMGISEPRMILVRVETVRRGTHLLARILKYRRDHDRLPAKLADLGDSIVIRSVCVDPYSGREFVYKVRDQRFTLYSLGIDGQDQGGSVQTSPGGTGDLLIWPIR